jgi:hypothetical protein
MSLKNPVTSPGIDPGTVRLVAQRLNYYATPGPFRTHTHLANHVWASPRNLCKFSRKERFLFSTLTKTGKGPQRTVQISSNMFDENTCRVVSVITHGQTERRGEPKRRVCVTCPVKGAKYR